MSLSSSSSHRNKELFVMGDAAKSAQNGVDPNDLRRALKDVITTSQSQFKIKLTQISEDEASQEQSPNHQN